MNQPLPITLSPQQAAALYAYLIQRPYGEVAGLVRMLDDADKAAQEAAKEANGGDE